jgi:magnesium-transporting ATPase (P-type)
LASDKLIGGAILAVSVIVLILVTVFMWVPPFSQYAAFVAELVVWLAVVVLMIIAGWIGWTIITTAAPPPLEPEKGTQQQAQQSAQQGQQQPQQPQQSTQQPAQQRTGEQQK